MIGVNEMFATIQGEATFTGMPSTFVRLQGCDVGCPWCDTKHTWAIGNVVIPIKSMTEKECDSDSYAAMRESEIIDEIRKLAPRHVVLTGGEPCSYNLNLLTAMLLEWGYSVQIETSGTYEIQCHPDVWVTVSPKIDMPGGRAVRGDALWRANEIKHPVGKQADVEKLKSLLTFHGIKDKPVWLQPLSQSKKATEVCIAAAMKDQFRLSLQTHKFIEIR